MSNSIFPTPFHLTTEELLLSAAATILFQELENAARASVTTQELCEPPQYGYTDSAKSEAVGPRFVRITDIKGGKVNWETVPYCACEKPAQYLVRAGDILVARAGSVGKSFLVSDVPEPAVFASYMIRLRAKDKTLPNYIYWFFQSRQFWIQVADASRGSAMGNINGRMLAGLTLPNATLSEQQVLSDFLGIFQERLAGKSVDLPELKPPFQNVRRIVARVEELAAKIEEARGLRRQAVEEADVLIGAALISIFGEGNKSGWTHLTLGEIVTDIRYGTSEKASAIPDGVPVLRMGNIQNGKLSLKDLVYINLPKDELDRLRLKQGDILVNRTNSAELVGKCAVFEESREFVYASYIIRLRLDREIVMSQFVAYFINSPIGRQYMFNQRKQMTGQANINSQKLKALPLSLPPLSEQRRIVAYLDDLQAKVDTVKRLQTETSAELEALLPSVLDRAFKGEL